MPQAKTHVVRITRESHEALLKIARADRRSMQEVLARAIEEYRRLRFLKEANAAYAGLRRDARQWKHETEERALWDATLRDGA